MQVSFTAHAPNHSMLTIQQRLEAAGFTNVHVNAISDSTQPFTRTNPETIQAYEEGKQLMQARYGRFDAMKEARYIKPHSAATTPNSGSAPGHPKPKRRSQSAGHARS